MKNVTRRWVAILGLLLGMALIATSASAASISVPGYAQEKSNWCWAATAKSVIQYHHMATRLQRHQDPNQRK